VIAVLLADNRFVAIDTSNGQFLAEHQEDGWALGSRHLLAAGPGNVYALMSGRQSAVVESMDSTSLAFRTEATFPSGVFASLAVGPISGRFFAFGTTGAAVTIVDRGASAGTNLVGSSVHASSARNVYSGGVSPDERRIYVSCHGLGTGMDWFDAMPAGTWRKCSADTTTSCVDSHGGFVAVPQGVLAATGDHDVVEVDRGGQIVRRFDTGLYRNHLMEFALDERRRIIYVVGSCISGGGLSAIPWPQPKAKGTPAAVLVPSGDYRVCGDHVSVSSDGTWLAIAAGAIPNDAPISIAARSAVILVVNASSGDVLRSIRLPVDPVDVLVLQ
jgi:hypothetical protein